MESYKYWKTSEVRYLKDNVNLPVRSLSKELGRSHSSIKGFMHKNNIHHKKIWNDKDIEFIKANISNSYSWFARHFRITKNAFGQFLNSRNIKFKDLREKMSEKKNLWWGYRHVSGSLQVKRFFVPLDIQDAEESGFCEEIYQPFEANNREEALAHIKTIIRGQKETIKAKDESKKKLQEIKDKETLRLVFEAGQKNSCSFDDWYNEQPH